jgi:hypothetical protein
VSPPVVDGIFRGMSKGVKGSAVSSMASSATRADKGAFGAGLFPEGK